VKPAVSNDPRAEKPIPATYTRVADPMSARRYCIDTDGNAIVQAGTPSGMLCSWELLESAASSGTPELVVIGEYVRHDDGVRFPQQAVNPAWMRSQGYVTSRGYGWHLPSEACDKERHVHRMPLR
jgi:hypothetical protein